MEPDSLAVLDAHHLERRRPAAPELRRRDFSALLRDAAHAACDAAPLSACTVPPPPRPCRAATMVTVTLGEGEERGSREV